MERLGRDFFVKIIRFVKNRYATRGAIQSFSGSGEDLIIFDILKKLKKKAICYIDIGSHDPIYGNNTYLLYRNGGSGILVEPNKHLCNKTKLKRSRDKCLNLGVGGSDGEADFYFFDRDTRSTFSKEESIAWEKLSGQKAKIEKKKLLSLDSIIKMLNGKNPDLVSIDTEGLEIDILSKYSWFKKPAIFCIENSASSGIRKDNQIVSIMKKQGYVEVAKTFANSIFIRDEEYKNLIYNTIHA